MRTVQETAHTREVRAGLLADEKSIPFRYFYDAEGSRLFDAITRTPEYYLTRSEAEILEHHAHAILAAARPRTIVELGCGSAQKTRLLLQAASQGASARLDYVGVDVSPEALAQAARTLAGLPINVETAEASYDAGLRLVGRRPEPRLVMFLGSSIGNFAPDGQEALVRRTRAALSPGDAFLLGTDLVKDAAVLHAAYNDAAGVTAAFNRNVLRHLNRVFDGDADVEAFDHEAEWQAGHERIQMRLRAKRDQTMTFKALDVQVKVRAGEAIHTEDSYKFTMAGVRRMVRAAGFSHERAWTDAQGWFALHLLRAEAT